MQKQTSESRQDLRPETASPADVDVVPAGDVDDDTAAALVAAVVAVEPASPAAALADAADADVPCGICKDRFPPNSRAKKCNWICCDICQNWFHNVCVGLGNRKPKA